MNWKKLQEDVLAKSSTNELPQELCQATIFTWDNDLDKHKDWDDFINGFKVAHTKWDGKNYQVAIDVENLTFGNNTQSFFSTLNYNASIEIYTKEYIDLNGKFVSIGTDIDTKYLAISYRLEGFNFRGKKDIRGIYLGKVVLVNVQKYLDEINNDASEAPVINIDNGSFGEIIQVPSFIYPDQRQTHNVEFKYIVPKQVEIAKPVKVEFMFPKAVAFIGADFKDKDDNIIGILDASTKPTKLPINKEVCIVPTQFSIPALDNYGFLHPNDNANTVKAFLASQAIGQAGSVLADTQNNSTTSKVISSVIGYAQKYAGDKGALATSLAITPTWVQGEGDNLKLFIEADATQENPNFYGGIIDITAIKQQNDYIELNQANGENGKYGKSMSPFENEQYKTNKYLRALGLETIDLSKQQKITALATPYANDKYKNLVIDDIKTKNFLTFGIPRQNINKATGAKPIIQMNDWQINFRNMNFRPDPYSFFNWPTLMASEMGIHDPYKHTSIAYDDANIVSQLAQGVSTATKDVLSVVESMPLLGNVVSSMDKFFDGADAKKQKEYESEQNANKRRTGKWNKTITMEQISNNDFANQNNTFLSLAFELTKNAEPKSIDIAAFTTSTIEMVFMDKDGNEIRTNRFNSKGTVNGTSASWLTNLTF